MLKVKDAITYYEVALESNTNIKDMLDQFIGKPEIYQLDIESVKHYLSAKIPDLKSVLRCTLKKNYKPANAAMSLVLRAGIEKGTKTTFDSIRESVAKINKSF